MSESSGFFLRQFHAECTHLLDQSLARIGHCVGQLDADQLWWRPGPDQNSVGILLLHLSGNLQQWGVDGILGQPDLRDRSAEFASDVCESAEELLQQLRSVIDSVRETIGSLGTD